MCVSNNEGYMNTGIQASSATISGTWTSTTPVGKILPGKVEWRKNLTAMLVAQGIPYAAQAAPHHWKDLVQKVREAVEIDGPSFINILAPCTRGWLYEPEDTIALSKFAVDTCMWPLYEVENGRWRVSHKPKKRPVVDWLKSQGRFAHLFGNGDIGALVETIQNRIDFEWNELLQRSEIG